MQGVAALLHRQHHHTAASDAAARESRRGRRTQPDSPLFPLFWPFDRLHLLRRLFSGTVALPALPPFPSDIMSFRSKPVIPATPRVISPSPTPSDRESSQDAYFGPTTRSAARKRRLATPQPVQENPDEDTRDGLRRARTRSRSPLGTAKVNGLTAIDTEKPSTTTKPEPLPNGTAANGKAGSEHDASSGHLSPSSAQAPGWSWRDFSRSPSPLGLIPIHRHWRTFVHKHEVPRKLLHLSIGFLVLWLYASGTQTTSVTPWLAGLLAPIATADYVRHVNAAFNRFYTRVLGAFMRESEVAGWNGVVFYLLGALLALGGLPKDVGVMAVLLLSWCDTAASTFGRLYGRFTPRIRRGKSLAGSGAAFLVGVVTAWGFWGWLAPTIGPMPGDEGFMFKGTLGLPPAAAAAVGLDGGKATVSGGLALALVSIWSGFAAAASEVVDVFGWDDNLTIPVLSGLGIWGFLKVFG
ncbi:putative phosphatidate cytidylyltransferase [Diaporthe ampelina]|uniref:Putative phosphatidate cytidylyltransferase n=1 Tax=Diaporthe ampelina TaxID=1214573 RepID=A0A0G2FRC2_9PEZI|nr:putative phosphatidate cytidylyltransferase [Diaporthe ampelina]